MSWRGDTEDGRVDGIRWVSGFGALARSLQSPRQTAHVIVFTHDPKIFAAAPRYLDLNSKPVPRLVTKKADTDAEAEAPTPPEPTPAPAKEAQS